MPTDDQHRPGKEPASDGWYAIAGAGFEFVVALLMFSGAGWLLDRWLDTAPWLLIAGAGLGFVVGLSILLKMARRTFRD